MVSQTKNLKNLHTLTEMIYTNQKVGGKERRITRDIKVPVA